jgi:iron complex outermembrane recepter protein
MNQFRKTAIALAVAQIAFVANGAAYAQSEAAKAADSGTTVVVVTGQRAALQSAQKIKKDADEVVDSIVADDIGKLPDRSVTEVLQRIVGVSIDRTMAKGDPEHYSVEGSGVTVRGLTYVRSELNGRDSFSANGGRSLNFEDVPPELMAGVDVYKNPSAEQIEGAVGGLVNLRTRLPFDFKGQEGAISLQETYSQLKKGKTSPTGSFMYSNRWKTGFGEIGALVDFAYSESGVRTDAFQVEPYYPRSDVVAGKTVWVPKGSQWRTLEFNRKRQGAYGALQWKRDANLNSTLTYFKSHYKMKWDEQAIFAQSSPYNIKVSPDATYDANGALLTGTLSDPTDGGINFGDDTRTATRVSDTTDVSWHVTWRASPSWTFNSDLQRIRATTTSFDSTVATGVQMPKETVNLGAGVPVLSFDAGDVAHLADPANYYWAFTMEHMDKSKAGEWAWKGDAKFDFDSPVLRDIRFGVRLTSRDSLTQNSNPGYNWAAVSQPWQVGWDIPHLAYLSDPRFSGNTNLHSFNNFFSGQVAVPSVVFPNVALANGYPGTYATLHSYHDALCAEQHKGDKSSCGAWTPATFGTDPSGTNDQKERTGALFTQLRFGFDDWRYPVDGNIGLRYVKTDMTAHGFTVFAPTLPTIDPTYTVVGTYPNIPKFSKAQDYDNTFHNVLPSLNLRMKASDKLQFRFGFASALSRPDFTQLQGYTGLSENVDATNNVPAKTMTINQVSLTGTSSGNPNLKPVTSQQFDLTAEWYFSPVGSLTLAVFDKRLKDIIINQSFAYPLPDVNGTQYDFTVTGPVNGARGNARGFELAYQQYFDKLPGWMSGFGVQGNFTFVDSHQSLYSPVFAAYCSGGNSTTNLNLNLNGCDLNGQTFGDLPLQGLSRTSYNLALMYDKGPLSARMAYNWRSKYLQAVNVNGTNGGDGTDTNPTSSTFGQHNVGWALPTWAGDYGTLDASVFYKLSDNLTLGLEGTNLTDSKYTQLMQQHIGMMGRAWFVSGPTYSARLMYKF